MHHSDAEAGASPFQKKNTEAATYSGVMLLTCGFLRFSLPNTSKKKRQYDTSKNKMRVPYHGKHHSSSLGKRAQREQDTTLTAQSYADGFLLRPSA
jgi:hypothetical protein